MPEKCDWHACCNMNGITGTPPDEPTGDRIVNIKTSLFSAVAALFVSAIAVGSAVVPASVAIDAPVAIALHA